MRGIGHSISGLCDGVEKIVRFYGESVWKVKNKLYICTTKNDNNIS